MSKDEKPSMFKSLLEKARCRELEVDSLVSNEDRANTQQEVKEPRKPGRPRGRRSNPDYTQISAYVPLDLYLEVQAELLKERKAWRQRRATDVSGLVEKLLRDWVNQRQNE